MLLVFIFLVFSEVSFLCLSSYRRFVAVDLSLSFIWNGFALTLSNMIFITNRVSSTNVYGITKGPDIIHQPTNYNNDQEQPTK